jgi:hypothetical protein
MKRLKIERQSAADRQPIAEVLPPRSKRRNPTPREEILLTRLAEGNSTSKALKAAGFHPSSTTLRNRLKPGGDLREEYANLMISKGLNPGLPLDKYKELLDATKHVTIAGEAIECRDNDIQLRAADRISEEHEKAGLKPTKLKDAEATGPQYHVHIQTVSAPS